jgi:hypothetical protein
MPGAVRLYPKSKESNTLWWNSAVRAIKQCTLLHNFLLFLTLETIAAYCVELIRLKEKSAAVASVIKLARPGIA